MSELEIRDILSKNLTYYMQRHHLTNKDLSVILGVSESTVGKWILKKATPRMGIIEKLALYFKINKSDLLEPHSNNEDNKHYDNNVTYYLDEESQILAQEMHDNPGLRILMDASRKVSPEDLQYVIDLAKRLRGDDFE